MVIMDAKDIIGVAQEESVVYERYENVKFAGLF